MNYFALVLSLCCSTGSRFLNAVDDIGDVLLVLSLCCSTGVRVGAFGSESTLYMVYFR